MADAMTLRRRMTGRMVADLRRRGWLHLDAVAEAFASVPRHVFVPDRPIKDVYTDQAFVTKQLEGVPVSSSSQPSIMAVMLEQLQLEPGQRVLEIGAGTGYNAALLSHLVGRRGRVTAIDIDRDTAQAARKHLRAARNGRVNVIAADGGYGHAAGAPYDRIIATASCWQIPQPWVDQLAEGGILVLPFRLNGAHVSLALRQQGKELVSTSAAMCGFMPLRGAFGPAHTLLSVPGMRVAAEIELGAAPRRTLLATLSEERPVRVPFPRSRDPRSTPLYYLALQGKPVLNLVREGVHWSVLPFGLAASPRSVISLPWLRPQRRKLTLFGGEEALDYLRSALARWQAEGRPDLRNLHARVRPGQRPLGPLPRRAPDGRYRFRRGDHLYELWFE